MTSLGALQTRVKAIQKSVATTSRLWVLVREEGKELSQEQRALIGPHDRIVIREMPPGYMDLLS